MSDSAMHVRILPTLYDQLEALPEGVTGEIIGGRLHTQARPTLEHGYTETSLAEELVGPFQKGRGGGPGGWLILVEPELHFIRDIEVDVPDLAGWRRERLPQVPRAQHRAMVVPDWVCEILSPGSERKDRDLKMPVYARFGVAYAWLIDPFAHTLEAYALVAGAWQQIGRHAGGGSVAVPPFDAVSIRLADLWAPTE